MPELPEVETVRRGLAPAMEGAVIARAEVNRPDLRWPFPPRMAERLMERDAFSYLKIPDIDGESSIGFHVERARR